MDEFDRFWQMDELTPGKSANDSGRATSSGPGAHS
jgi:hypothetical protein